jgi:hypothetical protein
MINKEAKSNVEQADRAITDRLNYKRDSWQMRLIGTASEIGDQPQMRLLCAATIGYGLIRRDSQLAGVGLKMLAAHTLATWGKSGVKSVVDRTRPESGDDPRVRPGRSNNHQENSFPSGHSAGAVAVAEAFARSYPERATMARIAAMMVAAVQVPRGTHYVGDVVVGMVIGLIAERASHATTQAALQVADTRLTPYPIGIAHHRQTRI